MHYQQIKIYRWVLYGQFVSVPYTTKYETTIYGKIISSGEIFLNINHLKNLGLDKIGIKKIERTEVVIPLLIIIHPKHNIYVPKFSNNFPGNLCIKSQRDSFLSKRLIPIYQFLYSKIPDELFRLDQIKFDRHIDNDSSIFINHILFF